MCDFLTVGVSDRFEASARARFGAARLSTAPSRDASVLAALPAGVAAFEVTFGGCSCGLSLPAGTGDAAAERDALRAKYRAKHPRWSDAKITRAVEAARLPSDPASGSPEAHDFCAIVAELAAESVVHVVRRTDAAPVRTIQRLSLADYERTGGALPSDTVVAIER